MNRLPLPFLDRSAWECIALANGEYAMLQEADANRNPTSLEAYVAHCRACISLAEGGMYDTWKLAGFELCDLEELGIGWDERTKVYLLPFEEDGQTLDILLFYPKSRKFRWWNAKPEAPPPALWRPDALRQGEAVLLCETVLDACAMTAYGFNATCLGKNPLRLRRAGELLAQRCGDDPVYLCWKEPPDDRKDLLIDVVRELRMAGLVVQRIRIPDEGLHAWLWYHNGLDQFKEMLGRAKSLVTQEALEDHPANCPRFPIEKLLHEKSQFVRRYYDWMRQSISAAPEFLYYGALMCISTVLGRRVAASWGPRPTYPNLFTMFVGESGRSFKSSAISGVSEVLHGLGERVHENGHVKQVNISYELPNASTPEAFLSRLFERTPRTWGILLWPEFQMVVQMSKREYMAGWFETLSLIYDCEDRFTKDTLRESFTIEYPCVSLLTGVQPRFFNERLDPAMLYGGFLPRFLVLAPSWDHASQYWLENPLPRSKSERRKLQDWLCTLRDHYPAPKTDLPAAQMTFEPEALQRIGKLGTNLFHATELEGEEFLGSFHARMPALAVKLAVLLSIDASPFGTVIPNWAVEHAELLIQHQRRVVRWMLRGRTEDQFQRRVGVAKSYIERCPTEMVDRAKLLRRLGCSVRDLKDVLEHLDASGFLREVGKRVGE